MRFGWDKKIVRLKKRKKEVLFWTERRKVIHGAKIVLGIYSDKDKNKYLIFINWVATMVLARKRLYVSLS